MPRFLLFLIAISLSAPGLAQSRLTDSTIALHNVTIRHEKTKTRFINHNRKCLNGRVGYYLNNGPAKKRFAAPITFPSRGKPHATTIHEIACRLDPYDTGFLNIVLLLKTSGPDSAESTYNLSDAYWEDGWLVCAFPKDVRPTVGAGQTLTLGYALRTTRPTNGGYQYPMIQGPDITTYFLPSRARLAAMPAPGAVVRVPAGTPAPTCRFVYRIRYSLAE